jgi:hypothetical protein
MAATRIQMAEMTLGHTRNEWKRWKERNKIEPSNMKEQNSTPLRFCCNASNKVLSLRAKRKIEPDEESANLNSAPSKEKLYVLCTN